MKHNPVHRQLINRLPVVNVNTYFYPLSLIFVLFCVQLPMGDSDQGCHEEVPEPHEP